LPYSEKRAAIGIDPIPTISQAVVSIFVFAAGIRKPPNTKAGVDAFTSPRTP
jgi:hypothetical protein